MSTRWRAFRTLGLAIVVGLSIAAPTDVARAAVDSRPIEMEDLFRFDRVSDPQISPDGRQVAFVVTKVLKDENRTDSDIWIVKADGSAEPRQLTTSPKHDRHPRWSPDGKWIAFESARGGETQIFILAADGGEARKLTSLFTGASQPRWSPDGRSIAFVSAVFPEFSAKPFAEADRLNREKQEAREKSKVKARVFDHLLYRHWDSWVEGKRQHLFVVAVNAEGRPEGEPRNVTRGENDAIPTSTTFSAGEDFVFSSDSREIVITAPPLPIRDQAWSTNHDLWAVDLQTGERKNLTAANAAADGCPRYSPDGRYLAYRAQSVAGFEADRWQLWLLDRKTGDRRSLTAAWDRSVNAFEWGADGKGLFIEAQQNASTVLFGLPLEGGIPTPLVSGGVNTALSVARDGQWMAFLRHSLTGPPEVARYDFGRPVVRPITRMNASRLAPIGMSEPESVVVSGHGGTPVQMWIVKPPGFATGKRYPLVFWVHGGPQSAFQDSWSTRWNPQVWAAQGYVIAMPNPRGSTGFGQQFTNEISRDWGGRVFEDLQACLAFMKQQRYVDSSRMAAAGASYGGYMMNWFQGHLAEFRCLVNHCGVYNFHSMYGTTEEVWFDEYDHGVPWENPDFDRFSPHRFAANFKTPMLIIHNDLDFRVPVSEGMQAFTTLQRKGIPSKLLMFPDEGHWVLKPQNSELWHKTIFEWLAEYIGERAEGSRR